MMYVDHLMESIHYNAILFTQSLFEIRIIFLHSTKNFINFLIIDFLLISFIIDTLILLIYRFCFRHNKFIMFNLKY